MSRVAFVKTRDREEGVRRALAILGFNPVLDRQVLLKPNLNSADPAPASTHPDTLRFLVESLRTMGAREITVGDRSGGGETHQVMEKLGVYRMGREMGFETLCFDDLGPEDWVLIHQPGSHWKQGFYFARPCHGAEALVSTCCLKPHRFGGHFTLSLKNTVGMVAKVVPGVEHNFMHELHGSPHQRKMIAEMNVAYEPALVLLDGVEAFISDGPERGQHAWGEVILAATDRVAIDAVGVAVLRHLGVTGPTAAGPIFEQEQIARAVELGLGVDSADKIDLATDDAASKEYAKRIVAALSDA